MTEPRHAGTVDWYRTDTGCGVIVSDEGGKHHIHRSNLPPELHVLVHGMKVSFVNRPRRTPKGGLEAYGVTVEMFLSIQKGTI